MYKLDSFANGAALVINTAASYRATFLAASRQAAEQIVVALNQPDLLAELATYRFERETGGLSVGGLEILTDRESQSQLANAYITLSAGLIPDTDWKAANGWEIVTFEQIAPIAKAVATHSRACFRGERNAQEAIKGASTIAEIEAIDIRALFDTAYDGAVAEVNEAAPATAETV